ncbi:MAG: CerR family C-terminal domain-containing protein [Candidatus Hydrogenedentes bacterium]|nr:CerR family C-terminal domain-containing protein [Candidatus Hydrogenedentota bacterium]
MSHYLTGNETRARLLEAAAEVFAEHGFSHAKVQDICQRAQANLAAINYHFGGKEQLYQAVIHYALEADEALLPSLAAGASSSPEERFRQFVKGFLFGMLSPGRPAWHGKLMMHEGANPTAALDLVIEHLVRPIHNLLYAIIGDLLGVNADPDHVAFLTTSVMSQCATYHHSMEFVVRMNPSQRFDPAALEQLADRIARFSLAGIRHYAAIE